MCSYRQHLFEMQLKVLRLRLSEVWICVLEVPSEATAQYGDGARLRYCWEDGTKDVHIKTMHVVHHLLRGFLEQHVRSYAKGATSQARANAMVLNNAVTTTVVVQEQSTNKSINDNPADKRKFTLCRMKQRTID